MSQDGVGTREKILIVEDSRSIRVGLRRRIEEELAFDVHVVESYGEARTALESSATDIFLTIADLNLPDSPHGEVVDLVCDHDVPCLVFTSDFSRQTRGRMLSKDIVDYIIKDAHAVSNVINCIQRLVGNRDISVMVVEDSASFRFKLCQLLRRQMFQVQEVEDAESLLVYLEKSDDLDLLLVDYELPGMDGIDLIRKIRSGYSKEALAIIGLSSSADDTLPARFIKSGANDFIPKPFSTEEFQHRVNHTVDIMDTFQALRRANEVKNRFIGMVVHDLRSPINGINGLSEMLLDGLCGDLSEEQQEIISYIHQANLHMNSMVGDLLDISAIRTGRLILSREMGNLKESVEKRLLLHAITASKKSITIERALEDVGELLFDDERIGQVIDNLMSNAIKFSHQGGRITVSLTRDGGQVVVAVKDRGQGIPSGEEQLLFGSFSKTSVRPTGGESSFGLGLSIVKSIVETHGGTVWVESVYGEGATFLFTLPVSVE